METWCRRMSNPELDRFGPLFVFQLAMGPLAGEGDILDVLEQANKPKALSAHSRDRSRDERDRAPRAVLLADKTLPCPNKLGPTLTHAVTGSALRVTR